MRCVLLLVLAALTPTVCAQQPVTFDRLLNAEKGPENWLMYSGNYSGYRYSPLDQIMTANVHNLHLRWLYQTQTIESVETTPLVVDGVMYLTLPEDVVVALDAETGRKFWSYSYKLPQKLPLCCGEVNRGLAILGNSLFMATLDAKVVALDTKIGRVLWKADMAKSAVGYSATLAPLVIKDKVLVGVSGGEYGIRGFIDAYDAATGKRAWRTYTIPGPGEPHFGTWPGDTWKLGGAPAWVTGTYDPDLNLTYWGTGNPAPDWNGDGREGDNLYSCSILALDADNGKIKWYFQQTPHDTHDWDSSEVPVLVDSTFEGQARKLLVQANRNGFFYVLDRQTGQYLTSKAFVKQTWAKSIDSKGRPIVLPGSTPTKEGVKVWPWSFGGVNWQSPSYSPLTRLFYVNAMEKGLVYYSYDAKYEPGLQYLAGGGIIPREGFGAIRALVPETGELKWEHKILTPVMAGVLSTAGNLVFVGTDEGNFLALDARTGQELWHFPTGGRIWSNPISFLSKGKQYVTIAAGDVLATFSLD